MDALSKYITDCCPILLQRQGSRAPQDRAQMARELKLIRKALPKDSATRMRAEFNFAPKNRMGWRAFKKWYGKLTEPPGYADV